MSDDELDVALDRRASQQEDADYVKRLYAALAGKPANRAELTGQIDTCKLHIARVKRKLAFVVDEAELHHLTRQMQSYELAMANFEESLRASLEPEHHPEPIEEEATEPVKVTPAVLGPAATRDERRAKIRAYKARHSLKTYGDVAHHMNKRWNHRTVIDKFIGSTGRREDDEAILNVLAKNALILNKS